jgi:hypothetical protein
VANHPFTQFTHPSAQLDSEGPGCDRGVRGNWAGWSGLFYVTRDRGDPACKKYRTHPQLRCDAQRTPALRLDEVGQRREQGPHLERRAVALARQQAVFTRGALSSVGLNFVTRTQV